MSTALMRVPATFAPLDWDIGEACDCDACLIREMIPIACRSIDWANDDPAVLHWDDWPKG